MIRGNISSFGVYDKTATHRQIQQIDKYTVTERDKERERQRGERVTHMHAQRVTQSQTH